MDSYSLWKVQNAGWYIELEKTCRKTFEEKGRVNHINSKDYEDFESFFDEVIFRFSFFC